MKFTTTAVNILIILLFSLSATLFAEDNSKKNNPVADSNHRAKVITQPLVFVSAWLHDTRSVGIGEAFDGITGDNCYHISLINNSSSSESANRDLPPTTIIGGNCDDMVSFNGNITFAANVDLDIDLQKDDPTPGTDEVTLPTITYTPLANSCTGGVTSLTATITDDSGVPTAGAGLPVLYWRINAGAYTAATGTFVSGNNYSFTFGAGSVAGDVISYYIVAQDNATTPNVAVSPASGAAGLTANPPSAATPPTTPSSFSILNSLSGTYTVGTGGAYATLTAAMAAYNNSCLTGPVMFSLTAATYTSPAETFPISINSNAFASAVNTLTIKPATGISPTITGANINALLKLNGADYVIIDGSNSNTSNTICPSMLATRDLTITNTNSAAAAIVWMGSTNAANGATNNFIKNTNLAGGASSLITFGIFSGSASASSPGTPTAAPNSNNTIENCAFKILINALSIQGVSNIASLDQNWVIRSNSIGSATLADKVTGAGMVLQNVQNFSIDNNNIAGVASSTSSTSLVSGIQLTGLLNGGHVYQNKISDIKQRNTGGYGANGIYLNATSTAADVNVFNNFIWDVAGAGFSTAGANDNGYGIMVNAGGGYNIDYNTVVMNVNQTSTAGVPAAINIGSLIVTPGSLKIRNNLFINAQTAGNTQRYAIYSSAANTVFSEINYNNYFSTTGPNLGFIGSARATLANIQAGFGGNLNSVSINPVFTSSTDLHLVPASNQSLNDLGSPIAGITTDIDCATRDAAAPDMGADEFTPPPCTGAIAGTASAAPAGPFCGNGSTTISATGYSTDPGIFYQWQSSVDAGFSSPVDIGSPSSAYSNLSTGTITAIIYYRLKVTCAPASAEGYSNVVTVTVNPLPTLTVSPTSGFICNPGGTAVSLVASGAGNYSWAPAAGLDITTGATVSANPSATTTYTVTCTDGNGCVNTTMVTVTVADKPAIQSTTATPSTICSGGNSQLNVNAGIFTPTFNGSSLSIPLSGTASPYPATISVNGLPMSGVKVKQVLINGLSHAFASDIDMLLQSPTATNVLLISDQGGLNPISNANLVLQDGAAAIPATIISGIFRPTTDGALTDNFPAPGPGNIIQANPTLASFTGDFNGIWRLFVVDDASGDAGSISSWSIVFEYGAAVASYSWSPNTFLNNATIANPLASNVTATTTYTVTATATSGCFSTADVTVNVNPLPTATVSGGGAVCSTDPLPNVSFALTGTGPWDLTYNDGINNIPVMGIATSPYVITNAPVGTYTVASVSDNNCPGTGSGSVNVLVNTASTWYQDSDMDGYGNFAVSQMACLQPPGYVSNNTDCNDNDESIHPNATETCDGCDKNCDGLTGNGPPQFCGLPTPANCAGIQTCIPQEVPPGTCLPEGAVYSECNNNPQTETCDGVDNDCDGLIDNGIPPALCVPPGTPPDLVYGGTSQCQQGTRECGGPCIGFVGPSAEICDGIDNNCNGLIDEGLTFITYYTDADGDGYGTGVGQSLCTDPGEGFATQVGDCNDNDPDINPGAAEICDGIDNDCSGMTDEDNVCVSFSIIAHPAPQYSCGGGPVSFSVTATGATSYRWQRSSDNGDSWVDLYDGDYGLISGATTATVTAGGASLIDINGTLFRCQVSADAETLYSNPALFTFGEPVLSISYANTSFCSDADPVEVISNGYTGGTYSATPGGLTLDALTGQIEPETSLPGIYTITYTIAAQNDCPAINTSTTVSIFASADLWYEDADGDSFGNAAVSLLNCGQPAGYVADNTDCDDTNPDIYPGAFEFCNGIDDDCDNIVDDNCCPPTGIIWYVASDAAQSGNGASWDCAFQNLQDAINFAGPGHEIWVKAGTYKPTQDPFGSTTPSNPRNKTFYLKDGVAIYGGFLGMETMRSQRDWTENVTTLSGDFNDNDVATTDPLTITNNSENAYHVVISISDDDFTVLDGFTVKGGNANDPSTNLTVEGQVYFNSGGGGMLLFNSTVIINNTIFSYNQADFGGGIYISNASPAVNHTSFNRNIASTGGAGIHITNSNLNLSNAEFNENLSNTGGGGINNQYSNLFINNVLFSKNIAPIGAGMVNSYGNSSIHNAVFSGNGTPFGSGGGIANYEHNTTITNGLFSGNSASMSGGIWHTAASIALINCTFSGNKATDSGAALNLNTSQSILKNCLIWNNLLDTATGSADASLASSFPVDITHSLIQGWNPTGAGNLEGIANAMDINYPQFVIPLDPISAPSTAGDFHLQDCSPAANLGNNVVAPATDLDGAARPFGSTVDLGAYERQTTGTAPGIWYSDVDNDGFGNPSMILYSCIQPAGYVANNTDCNDNNVAQNPNTIWYLDADIDGYYTGTAITQCSSPGDDYRYTGILGDGDCNDNNAALNPGATEICDGIDNDCNGTADEGLTTRYYYDFDGDGYGESFAFIDACAPSGLYTATIGGDCIADDPTINPGATEICDGKDNDCNGQIDEGFITRYFYDNDGDGYGQSVNFVDTCEPFGLYTAIAGGDCNENDANIHPGMTEICNGIDDNCDGTTDEGFPIIRYYYDGDEEGYGDSNVYQDICGPRGLYTTMLGGDCNDGDNTVHPNAPEICDGIDNDCNGMTDDGLTFITYYTDADADGYGTGSGQSLCEDPGEGFASLDGDCNDNNAAINPAATEICDGIDNDCNGMTDDGLAFITYYTDADGDGYGTGAGQSLCEDPGEGFASLDGDCNDNNAAINPAATEICDGIDNDCNGMTDDGLTFITYYTDADGDGYGTGVGQSLCEDPGEGFATIDGDCNDNNAAISPAASEICDELDNDCDGLIDTNDPSLLDNISPSATCSNQTVNFNGENILHLNVADLVVANDNCGIQSINLSPASISSSQVGQTVPIIVTVTDYNGNTANCTSQIEVSGLPQGWSQNSNGVGCSDGNEVDYNPATQIWTATSTNCYYGAPFTSDASAFAQRTLCGDGSITAQVTGISGTALGWAGVIMRESNDPGAKKAQLSTNMAGNQSRREFRVTTNGSAIPQNFASQNRFWLRVVRSGNQFTMYNSPNGTQWYLIAAMTISMNSCIEVGLVATNYSSNSTVTATFANVSYIGNGPVPASSLPSNGYITANAQYQPDFSVYPNPTSGELNIDLKDYIGKNVQLELYSLEGKLMQFISMDEVLQNTQTMLLDRYSSGMYFVKLKSAGLPDVTKRVVLNKG